MTTPAELYRNAIDLNRFSNSVAKRIAITYNDLILDAVDQLRGIDELAAPVKAARLRAILTQLKGSLDNWAEASTLLAVEELQGLAVLQSEFVTSELAKALPVELANQIRSVQISPQFAQAVATIDPTALNVVTLSDDLQAAVTGAPQAFRLTAAQGSVITLPNGKVLEKSFRGLAESQADLFSMTVRNGLLTGESTDKLARRLKGRLRFGQPAMSLRQMAQAGGEVTAVANHQVMALVRTSINQVANASSQQVYEANQDVTKKYRYVATLDSRTSPICRALDGKEFVYGKGPVPPQHFNCLPGDAQVTTSGSIAAVYRRHYQGLLYVIKTTNGQVLRVTPNHPVLTSAGWKPANLVQVGDQVFASNIIPPETIANDQKHHVVTTAEDVFRAFRESASVFTVKVPTAAPDFHGDTSSAQGAEQIAVVLANWKLLFAVNPGLLKTLLDFSFKRSNLATTGSGHFDPGSLGIGAPASCSVSGGSQSLALVGGGTAHASKLLLTPVAELAPGFQDDALYGTWRDAEAIRDAANADALVEQGYNQADVCWIGWEPFSGHVYNFETESGTYCADSILTHNCRSTTVPIVDYKGLGFDPPPPSKRSSRNGLVPSDQTYGQWLENQSKAVKDDVLGASKVPYFESLVKKVGPTKAIRKFVSQDGSELTLAQLRRRYPDVKPAQ